MPNNRKRRIKSHSLEVVLVNGLPVLLVLIIVAVVFFVR